MDSLTICIPREHVSLLKEHIKQYTAFTADIHNGEVLVATVPYAGAESHEQALALKTFVDGINPDMRGLFININKQVTEQLAHPQVDPKEQMQKYLDSVCPIDINGETASAGFWRYYNELRDNIGEAMGPVSYAAFTLAKYVEEQNLPAYAKEHDAGTKWVWDFVKYYEEHWEF